MSRLLPRLLGLLLLAVLAHTCLTCHQLNP